MSKIVMIIPPERFRDEELFVTMEELENNGHTVVVVSTKIGIIMVRAEEIFVVKLLLIL